MHVNLPEARYCEICGAPTTYYLKKALPDYTDALNEKVDDLVAAGIASNAKEGVRMLIDIGEEELVKRMKPKYRTT